MQLDTLISAYKCDPESVYHTWFLNGAERLKAFRSIRRGVQRVVDEIAVGDFGKDFKGSSLETVLNSITEQKEVFEGAAHPFYWKPKLRIPDIYENRENQQRFGHFLGQCLNATTAEEVLKEIVILDSKQIKGLGPSVSSILYFLHPTLLPPCNTAIVTGFNRIFGERIKLGSWNEYLRMREIVEEHNIEYRKELSNDLGAIAGLLYEAGTGRILPPSTVLSETERTRIEQRLRVRRKAIEEDLGENDLHTEIQHHLLTIGSSLGYDVMCASNDKGRSHDGSRLDLLCLKAFPTTGLAQDVSATVQLIDVLWFDRATGSIAAGFEVEKSTSIYSGILRLTDLSLSIDNGRPELFIVIPDARQAEVRFQLGRPSLRSSDTSISYILFSELRKHSEALCKFGTSVESLKKIAQRKEG